MNTVKLIFDKEIETAAMVTEGVNRTFRNECKEMPANLENFKGIVMGYEAQNSTILKLKHNGHRFIVYTNY